MSDGSSNPYVIVLAGPNGAGKSTAAPRILPEELAITNFVNADVIAQGLAGFQPESAAIEAGRIMLERLSELAALRESFAFETTLSGRNFARRLKDMRADGYDVHIFYLYLPDADTSVSRVAHRVKLGGHSVPEDVIRRRYELGLRNLFQLYLPLSTTWNLYENSMSPAPNLIASGEGELEKFVVDRELFLKLKWKYGR